MAAIRTSDYRYGSLLVLEPAGFPVRPWAGLDGCFKPIHVRPVNHLDSSHVLDVSHSFPSRNYTLQRVPIFRAHRLAVLGICQKYIIHGFFHWDTLYIKSISRFDNDPASSFLDAGLSQQHGHEYPCPLAATGHPVCFLDGRGIML